MNFEDLLKQFKSGQFKPVYILMGEEPFFIDQLVDYLEEHVIDESLRSFNQTILYGKDTTVDTVLAEAKRYPMMGDRQLVIVKEAQQLKKLDELEPYLLNPQPTTVLVLAHKYKSLDKRTKFSKTASNAGVVFESKKIYDNQLPTWIERLVRDCGLTISPKATQLIAEHLGTDLGRVYKEIEKLKLLLPNGAQIDDQVVEAHVGISKEFNNFELIKALTQGDHYKAQMIANYFKANPKDNPIVVTLGVLYSFFTKVLLVHSSTQKDSSTLARTLKVAPMFVQDYINGAKRFSMGQAVAAIGLLRQYDGKAKGLGNSSADGGDLLRELLTRVILG